jgi:hypothetical protein
MDKKHLGIPSVGKIITYTLYVELIIADGGRSTAWKRLSCCRTPAENTENIPDMRGINITLENQFC